MKKVKSLYVSPRSKVFEIMNKKGVKMKSSKKRKGQENLVRKATRDGNRIDYQESIEKSFKEAKIVPNKNCKKCFGKGYTSFNVMTEAVNYCKCIYPSLLEASKAKMLEKEKNEIAKS